MTATNLYHVSHALGFFNWFPEASHPTGVLVASNDLDTRLAVAHHLHELAFQMRLGFAHAWRPHLRRRYRRKARPAKLVRVL